MEPQIQETFTTLKEGLRLFHSMSPQRQDLETYEEYKFRQKILKRATKKYLNPKYEQVTHKTVEFTESGSD